MKKHDKLSDAVSEALERALGPSGVQDNSPLTDAAPPFQSSFPPGFLHNQMDEMFPRENYQRKEDNEPIPYVLPYSPPKKSKP